MKILKIFIYNCSNGDLIEEHTYNNFVMAFNSVIAHNYLHENKNEKRNILIDSEYPPNKIEFINGEWVIKNSIYGNYSNYGKLIKLFE